MADNITEAEAKKARASRGAQKADKAITPLKLIIFSLTLLAGAFLMLHTGLQGVTGVVEGQIAKTAVNRYHIQGQIRKEVQMRQNFELLMESRLANRIWEPHTVCLLRGVRYANAKIHGEASYTQYPDVVNATTKWVQDECDRLSFTPQAPSPTGFDLRRGLAVAKHQFVGLLGTMKDNIQESVVEPVKFSVRNLLARIKSGKQHPVPIQRAKVKVKTNSRGNYTSTFYTMRPLPRDFYLVNCENGPCQLVYMPPEGPVPIRQFRKEDIEIATDEIATLDTIKRKFWKMDDVVIYFGRFVLSLQGLCLLTIMALEYCRSGVTRPPFRFFHPRLATSWQLRLEEFDIQLLSGIAGQIASMVAIDYIDRVGYIRPVTAYACSIVVGFLLLILWFTTSHFFIPNVHHILVAWILLHEKSPVPTSTAPASSKRPANSRSSGSNSAGSRKKAKVSPSSPLQEDLKAVRAEGLANSILGGTLEEISQGKMSVVADADNGEGAGAEDEGNESDGTVMVSDQESDWGLVSRTSAQSEDD